MKTRPIDRRKHPRQLTPSVILLSFTCLSVSITGIESRDDDAIVLNLSEGGCKIVSETPLLLGHSYRLTLHGGMLQNPIRIECAEVCWADRFLYGLTFTRLHADDDASLRAFLADLQQR